MNFQSIFFVLSIFAQFTFGYSKISTGRNLTVEENQKRLDNCGKEGLPNPPNPSKSPTWFWVSYQTLPDKTRVFTSASQISSRHFLTSPITVLTRDMKWIHNGSQFDGFCQGQSEHLVEIPTDVVKRLKLTPLSCYRDRKCKTPVLTPLRAFIPLLCEMMVRMLFSLNYTPMIVEVQNDIFAHPVCINHRMYSIEEGDKVTSYRLYEDTTTSQSELTVTPSREMLIETTKIASTGNFSGPIVKLLADKWTIVAYIPSYSTNKNIEQKMRIAWFQYAFCMLTGICDGEPTKTTIPVPTIPPIKATVPVTTAKLTTANKPAAIVTRITPTPTPRPVPNTFTPVKTSVPMTTTPLRSATSKTVASTKSPITVAVVQKTLPPTMVHLTTATTTPTTVATVKPVITKPPEALTTVMSMKTSPSVKTNVATATVGTTIVTTVPTTVKPAITKPSGPFTTITSTTSSTKPLPVSKTVTTVTASTIGETTSQVTTDSLEIITINAQVTTYTTPKAITKPDSMTVPTILPQNSTEEATPDSSVDPSSPTNQTTHPEDPPPDDPVTYEPPLALGIDFSLGPEHSIDEPPIDYEEYEERKKHMDDDDQDYKDFWMDETGNGGEKGMRLELLLILVIHFMRLQ